MSLRKSISKIWNDPVWSKVIAAAIIAGFGIFLKVGPFSRGTKTALWIAFTIALATVFVLWLWSRRKHKLLVFVSKGGTCRDPMAKAITEKLLKDKKLNHPVEVVAAGLAPTRKTEASYAARFVIKEMFDEDLLRDHKPTQLTPEIIHSADLILLMDRSLLVSGSKSLPPEKTFILKEFFGGAGDIKDPYPDGRDDRTIGRYRKCAQELRQVLSQNLDALVSKLEV